MSGFKLLGIRPLKYCDERFKKNLRSRLFQFYNDYTFVLDKKEDFIKEVKFNPTFPENFFDLQRTVGDEFLAGERKPIKLNISAVVGKNGSGKSALSELFLYAMFIVSNKLNFIKKEEFLDLDKKVQEPKSETKKYERDLDDIARGLKVEVIYCIEEEIYLLRVENGDINLQKQKLNLGEVIFNNKEWMEIRNFNEVEPLFYSMLVNYSFYSFNSNQMGTWIKAFFHKNDGYQMPIVINPYRNEGIMDINNETYLTRSRLISNILSIEGYRDVNPKSPISEIELYFDERKDYKFLSNGEPRYSTNFRTKFRELILKPLFEKLFEGEYTYPEIISETINDYAEIYIINKLINIPKKYILFKKYNSPRTIKESVDNFKLTRKLAGDYVESFAHNKSHITLKVRQALNFLKEDIYGVNNSQGKIKINFESVIEKIGILQDKYWFRETNEFIPPSFFVCKIKFEDGSYFEEMSSGEKQKIFSLNSIVYHLKNIDSVHKNYLASDENNTIKYTSVNLILDEIELYYHPDFQKNIIHDLREMLEGAKYLNIDNINILFLTHSPFILSDIPNQNVLKLENGKAKDFNEREGTFGANIYTLLNDTFYMGNTMGKFAEEKIKRVLRELKEKDHDEGKKIFQVIELIGEPMIKEQLEYVYNEKFKDSEVDDLKQQINYLREQLKQRGN